MTAIAYGAADRAYALVPAATQSANVTAAPNQLVPCDTTARPFTVTLPAAPPDLTMAGIKLLAGAHPLTIVPGAGAVFDSPSGATSQSLTMPGQGVFAQYDAGAALWRISSDELPLADLDARYVLQDAASVLDWISVTATAYGAKGDGVTDDTAAIQAAINAGGGRIVYLPATSHSYLLNSSALTLTVAGTILWGAGAENAKLLIGSGFTGAAAVEITAYNCQARDLSISGASSTTTSNPVADGIQITGVRRAKIDAVTFFNVNGWAVNASATSGSSTSNPLGTQLTRLYIGSCAGGIKWLGNTTQGYAVNSEMSNIHIASGGVSSGASANLDGLRIEDAWDVLAQNVISWTSVGTGSSLHVKGKCAATFVNNFDGLGPNTGPCVLIEDGPNGSPQNVQIMGGVIQQGSPGVLLTGGAAQVHITTSRIINNQTHGIQIAGTNTTIYLDQLFYSLNGAGAAGTNYDLDWSGTAAGFVTNNRFASPIVASGTAGVQSTVNVASAGQNVRFINTSFQGAGSSSTNWFTNLPAAVLDESSGNFDFVTGFIAKGNAALQPTASGNTVVSVNVGGSDAFDRFRLTGDGTMAIGTGSAARDTSWGRLGTAQVGSSNSDIAAGLAGKGFRAKEGSNAKQGVATLAAGTLTVANTSVTATSRILLTSNTDGGTPGWLRVSARVAGTSFTITSSSAADTSVVAYQIFEPA